MDKKDKSKWKLPKITVKPNKILVFGLVKPNGRAKQVLDQYNIKEEKLEKEYILVIACGTNDVAANEAKNALDTIKKPLMLVLV